MSKKKSANTFERISVPIDKICYIILFMLFEIKYMATCECYKQHRANRYAYHTIPDLLPPLRLSR